MLSLGIQLILDLSTSDVLTFNHISQSFFQSVSNGVMSSLVGTDELNVQIFNLDDFLSETFDLSIGEILNHLLILINNRLLFSSEFCKSGFRLVIFILSNSILNSFCQFLNILKFFLGNERIFWTFIEKFRNEDLGNGLSDNLSNFVPHVARVRLGWGWNYRRWTSDWKVVECSVLSVGEFSSVVGNVLVSVETLVD